MIESLKKITQDDIRYEIKATLKSISTRRLKLPAANMTCYLGITNEGIPFSVFRNTNLKEEVFQDILKFKDIEKINIKQSCITKQKIIEIKGTNNTSFKFQLNNSENLNLFLENLNN